MDGRKTLLVGMCLAAMPALASASTFTTTTLADPSVDVQTLATALATGAGITSVGTATYNGLTTVPISPAASNASGTFQHFDFAGGGGQPPISIADGIILTNGTANVPAQAPTATLANSTSTLTGTGPSSAIETTNPAFVGSTSDSAELVFTFSVAPGVTDIEIDIVYGTEEAPFFFNVDPFVVLLDDGVGATQNLTAPVQASLGDPTFYNDNFTGLLPVGSTGPGPYPVTYNGLTSVLTLTASIADPSLTQTLTIAIADAGSSINDSALFVSNLRGVGVTAPIPLPAPAWLLLGSLATLAYFRRRPAA